MGVTLATGRSPRLLRVPARTVESNRSTLYLVAEHRA